MVFGALANGQTKTAVPFPADIDLAGLSVDSQNGPIALHVSGNGAVEYNGAGAVIVEGKRQLRIKPAEVQALIDAFRRAHFLSLSDHYSGGAAQAGTPTISLAAGTVKKTVTA